MEKMSYDEWRRTVIVTLPSGKKTTMFEADNISGDSLVSYTMSGEDVLEAMFWTPRLEIPEIPKM